MKCSVHHLPVQYLLSPPLIARLCSSDPYWSGMTEQFYYINTFFINCPVTWGPLRRNDESIIFLYAEIPFWYTKSNQNAIKSFTESFLFSHLSESSKWTPHTLIMEHHYPDKGCLPNKKRKKFQTIVKKVGGGDPQIQNKNWKLILDKSIGRERAKSVSQNFKNF